jgi:CheY-like chemotaxis protein
VVDDDHLVRALLQLGQERSGVQAWSAANGGEAIRLHEMHRESINVVLLDIRMPGLDGPATLVGLRQLNAILLACFMRGDPGRYAPEDLRQEVAPTSSANHSLWTRWPTSSACWRRVCPLTACRPTRQAGFKRAQRKAAPRRGGLAGPADPGQR